MSGEWSRVRLQEGGLRTSVSRSIKNYTPFYYVAKFLNIIKMLASLYQSMSKDTNKMILISKLFSLGRR